jgi:hypothetical protein
MFCPTCGRENSIGRKFCVACGTNLEAISQALSGIKTDFFTRTDAALDQLIARYSEHVFKEAPAQTADSTVGKSWKLLGQGVLTSLLDLILFSLMWNIFPLRFLILLISSPIRLLYARSARHAGKNEEKGIERLLVSETPEIQAKEIISISEQTTERFQEYEQIMQKRLENK